jgi:integrase
MTESRKRRNPSGLGSFRQRRNGLWEGRITLPDGERVSVYGKTETEVKHEVRERLRDAERGLDTRRGAVTVKAYMTQWIADAKESGHIREGTWRAYNGHVQNHIIPALGRLQLRNLTPHHVNQMLSKIVTRTDRSSDADGKRKGGVSPTTANRVRATLRIALNDAVSARMIPDNAAKLSRARKERRERIRPLELEQVRQLFACTKDHDLGTLIRIAVATGLRQGELLALEWRDVDLDAAELHVRHTLTRTAAGEWRRSETKTDRSRRTIKLTPATVAAFRKQRALNAEKRLLAAQHWKRTLTNPGYRERGEKPNYSKPHSMDLVFITAHGNPQHGSNVTHRLQAVLEEAGLPNQRFHDLRHATASLLLAEGMDLFTVKEILGHSQISLTANLYGHLTSKLAAEAAERLSKVLDEDAG